LTRHRQTVFAPSVSVTESSIHRWPISFEADGTLSVAEFDPATPSGCTSSMDRAANKPPSVPQADKVASCTIPAQAPVCATIRAVRWRQRILRLSDISVGYIASGCAKTMVFPR
jgi:hypothetical protein